MSVNIFKNGILSKIAGAVGDAVPLINNFLTNQAGKGAADANTVYVLNNKIDELNSSLGNVSDITNDTYNNIVALINYWQSKGELSDPTEQALIPTMTSDSYPSGVSSCSSRYNTSGYYAYLAFDGTDEKWNSSKTGTSEWIQYKFENPVNAKKITYTNVTNGADGAQNSGIFKFQVSSDGSNWVDVSGTITQSNGSVTFEPTQIQYVRCLQVGGSNGLAVTEMQVYS